MAAKVLPATAHTQFPGIEALGGVDFLHGESDATLTVHFEDLDLHFIAFCQLVADFLDALVGDLRDVYEAIFARQNRDECTEVHQSSDLAIVNTANFNICCDQLNAALRLFA